MSRVFFFIMDGFGLGFAPDAAAFGDAGAATFLHVTEQAKPTIPTLAKLGLGKAQELVSGIDLLNAPEVIASFGAATEVSKGKDTITGHWELLGVPLDKDWGYFPKTNPAFPQALMDEILRRCNLPGFLCMAHASGTEVIEHYGLNMWQRESPFFIPVLTVSSRLRPTRKPLACSGFMMCAPWRANFLLP